MECFTELRQRCRRRRHKSTVFVMEIRWIIVFKVQDQWQNIGRAFIVVRRNKRQMTTCAWNYIKLSLAALVITADFNDSEMFYAADRGSCCGWKCCVHSLWHNRRRPFGGHRRKKIKLRAKLRLHSSQACGDANLNLQCEGSVILRRLSTLPVVALFFHTVWINLFQGASNRTLLSHNNITKSLSLDPRGAG